jgi:drug/metabolite transporter (DMT)-like permease
MLMKSNNRLDLSINDLYLLIVVLIWGGNFSVVKIAFADLSPMAFTALRFLIASVLIMALVRFVEGDVSIPGKSLGQMIWLGLVGNTIYQILFAYGLSLTTASNSALLISTTPVFVALFGYMLGIERLTASVIGGILLAFIGVVLVIAVTGLSLSVDNLKGDLMVLGATLCWSVYTLGVRSATRNISSLKVTAITMVTGTPGLVLVAIPSLIKTDWNGVSLNSWLSLLYAIFLALIVCYVLWNRSIKKVGGSRTAIYACATPVVAIVVAWFLLSERPHPLQWTGASLIILGLVLSRWRTGAALEQG